MGIGKVLPTLVILSISAMIVFSLFPVYAHEEDTSDHGKCQGPAWNGPDGVVDLFTQNPTGPDPDLKDRNGNDHVCWRFVNGNIQYRDDNPLPK